MTENYQCFRIFSVADTQANTAKVIGMKQLLCISIVFFIFFSCTKPEVTNMGIFMPGRLNHVAGQDGCTPIPISRNKIIWTFGDTILGKWNKKISVNSTFESSATIKAMLSNSLAVTPSFNQNMLPKMTVRFYKNNKRVTEFISFKRDENPFKIRLWPGDGIVIKNTLYIYYTLVKITKKGPLPFKTAGTGIVSLNINNRQSEIINNAQFKRHKLLFNNRAPHFGDTVINHRKWLYVLGRKKSQNKKSVWLALARVRPSMITKASAYSFLKNDATWTSNPMKTDLIKYFAAGEASISYNQELKSFIIIFMSRDGILKALTFKTVEDIYKGRLIELYKPPILKEAKKNSLQIYYSGKEVFSDQKNIYCIYIHPLIYQPILVKVPIELFAVKN